MELSPCCAAGARWARHCFLVEIDDGAQCSGERLVAVVAEGGGEVMLDVAGSLTDLRGQPPALPGGVERSAAGIGGVSPDVAEPAGDEGLGDPLGVHRVGAEPAGKVADPLAGFGCQQTEHGGLGGGQPEIGEAPLPAAALGAVGDAEEETDAVEVELVG